MLLAFSINGVPIRLTEERWKHIIERHPELKGKEQDVLESIANPSLIQKGDVGTLLAAKKKEDRFLVTIYKEVNPEDGFLVTAYYTKKLRRRLIIWKP